MALVTNNISGSANNSSKIGITGSLIIANVPAIDFPSSPTDAKFFVSGTYGDQYTAKSVFGGDLVGSGSIKAKFGLSGSLTKLYDGKSYLIAGQNITITSQSNGSVTIESFSGGGYEDEFFSGDLTANVLSVNHGLGTDYVHVSVYDENDYQIIPDEVIITGVNTLDVVLTSYTLPASAPPAPHGWFIIVSVGGTTAVPAPPDKSIQFNDGGVFGGDANFTFDKVNDRVHLTGSFSEGLQTAAEGSYSHAEGYLTTGSGFFSHTEGIGTLATGAGSHAEGLVTVAEGDRSHAEGAFTYARGTNSHTEGYFTTSSNSSQSSHAEGYYSVTNNQYAHAEGDHTLADGPASHSEGYFTTGSGQWSHAEGYHTEVISTAVAGHSEGYYAIVSGSYSHAEGYLTIAEGQGSHSEGGAKTKSYGTYSHAEGRGTTSSGSYSHSEGRDTYSNADYSHAEGYQAKTATVATYSHAEGYQTETTGSYSHAEGYRTKSEGAWSHAEGRNTKSFGDYSHAEGFLSTASGSYSHTEGLQTIAEGVASHAEGGLTVSLGAGSHSEGRYTFATGSYSHTEGYYTTGSGEYSHAEGSYSLARGFGSHAEGQQTIAFGDYSHAEGLSTYAQGDYSHTEGWLTTGSAIYSHAEGEETFAGAQAAHAEGRQTLANARAAHAEGYLTTGSGIWSHAEGELTAATGRASHAGGLGTRASANYQTAIGQYNDFDSSSSTLFIIGNGTSDSSRKTIFKVTTDGVTIDRSNDSLADITAGPETTYHLLLKNDNNLGTVWTWGLGILDDGVERDLYFSYGNALGTPTLDAKGYISNGAGPTQMNFTGQHRSSPGAGQYDNFVEKIGYIVASAGTYSPISGSQITINDAVPIIELSTKRNDKRCFGVISDIEDSESNNREFGQGRFVSIYEKQSPDDNRVYVNSLGEGCVWVCNVNGNLENGDYITTCEIPGMGMKQDDDLLHNYTVAKITCDCDFDLNSAVYKCEEFEYNGNTYRRAFVGCTYHCG